MSVRGGRIVTAADDYVADLHADRSRLGRGPRDLRPGEALKI